jgi:anti-sigma factor RsiW
MRRDDADGEAADGDPAMTCSEVRAGLLDYQRGRLPVAAQRALHAHLEQCADCGQADAVERELTSVLERTAPQYPASLALKRRIAAAWLPPAVERSWTRRWRPMLMPALAVAATLLVAIPTVYYDRAASREARVGGLMVAEAVNDHLRVVTSQHPLDIESGGIHQVKPWFDGRLDFAPVVPFEGDDDFVLKGGAVGYFLDRKAAVLVYTRRLHPITLLVFRADGLGWPPRGFARAGVADASTTVERGFNVIMWQRAGLGYALVSDLNNAELRELAAKLAS